MSNLLDCIFQSSVGLGISNETVHKYDRCIASLGNHCHLDVNNGWFLIRLDTNRHTAESKFFDVVLNLSGYPRVSVSFCQDKLCT